MDRGYFNSACVCMVWVDFHTAKSELKLPLLRETFSDHLTVPSIADNLNLVFFPFMANLPSFMYWLTCPPPLTGRGALRGQGFSCHGS